MNTQISRLIHFAMQNEMIDIYDKDYSINLLLDVFKLDTFQEEEINEELIECSVILEEMLEYAVSCQLILNTMTEKDLFSARIMNCIMPRPNEVITTFQDLYKKNPMKATDYYYRLSIASDYIKKSRIDKNMHWQVSTRYGAIQMSINLSKPEKDPQEIAKAKMIKSSSYPLCLLCKENVGFAGDFNKPARQNHRIIPISLNNHQYYLQYSPYVYYKEHCIVFNEKHIPMVINQDTFTHLLSFLDYLPHYFIGSNADLPIVGGSILSHDHYQGGHHRFPIEDAKILYQYKTKKYPTITVDLLQWPLSTIRLSSTSKEELIAYGDEILQKWISYSDESVDIISNTKDVRHNTITPIARYKDNQYQLELVLRNNRTTKEYPNGIFHPHQDVWHIKKENIGLIEVMGLSILPARLKEEMEEIKQCLLNHTNQDLGVHQDWYQRIKDKHSYTKDNVDQLIKEEMGIVFARVLEDAGVFKMDEKGIQAFQRFMEVITND